MEIDEIEKLADVLIHINRDGRRAWVREYGISHSYAAVHFELNEGAMCLYLFEIRRIYFECRWAHPNLVLDATDSALHLYDSSGRFAAECSLITIE